MASSSFFSSIYSSNRVFFLSALVFVIMNLEKEKKMKRSFKIGRKKKETLIQIGEKQKRITHCNNELKQSLLISLVTCVFFCGRILNGRKKRKKHPFKWLLVTLLKRKREAKCKSFWAKSGSRLWFCGKKSQLQWRVQNHLWSLLTKWSWVQSHWLRNDSKEDCVCFCRFSWI